MKPSVTKVHYFHAEANALGGFIDKPVQKTVPPQASSSLPAVGGHVSHRTEAFNFEGVVSCRSAYTRVSGRHVEDGTPSTVATSVIEGLNIGEVVTAERIVAQVSIQHPAKGDPIISFTGSRFDGLLIGGCNASLSLNPSLLEQGVATASRKSITWPLFQDTSKQQATELTKNATAAGGFQWIIDRYGWLTSRSHANGFVLCSLVNGVNQAVPGMSFGHILHVPNFGNIIFGEVVAFPTSVHLHMVRAELGSPTSGGMIFSSARVNGIGSPP